MGCDIARPAGRDGFALSKTDEKKCKVDGCRLEAIKGSVYCKSHLRDWESGNVAGTYDKLASRRRTPAKTYSEGMLRYWRERKMTATTPLKVWYANRITIPKQKKDVIPVYRQEAVLAAVQRLKEKIKGERDSMVAGQGGQGLWLEGFTVACDYILQEINSELGEAGKK